MCYFIQGSRWNHPLQNKSLSILPTSNAISQTERIYENDLGANIRTDKYWQLASVTMVTHMQDLMCVKHEVPRRQICEMAFCKSQKVWIHLEKKGSAKANTSTGFAHWLIRTAEQDQAITWFCCQTTRWNLGPNLPAASCRAGNSPINPLGPFVSFVPGIEHLSGGSDQFFRALPLRKPPKHCRRWHHRNHSSLSLVMSAAE